MYSKSPKNLNSKNEKKCSCFVDSSKNLNSNSTFQQSSNSTTNSSGNFPQNLVNSNKVLESIHDAETESQWLHFDDTKVKSLSNIEFHRKIIDSSFDSPYILFYVKV